MNTGLWTELKRRHLPRIALVYAAVGLLLSVVANWIFPLLDVPPWSAPALMLLVAAGFPIAVFLAWAYEITPEGVRRTEPAHSPAALDPAHVHSKRRNLNPVIIVVLALAVSLLLWREFVPRSISVPSERPADTSAAAPDTRRSIAVLPFENRSTDPANGYLAEGTQIEILTQLTTIDALKVISRDSTRQYASRPENASEIAQELGVSTLLQGSVQKAGDRVRVTVQLIDALNGSQLWAETFDRTLDDVFAVQSGIASKVADMLHVTLQGSERAAVAIRATSSPAAYDAYLRGLALESRALGSSEDGPRQAAALYTEATRLDPEFALAFALLAKTKSLMYANLIDRTPGQIDEIRQAAETALALQPELAEAHMAMGYYYYRCLHDFDRAVKAFEQARQRLPSSSTVLASIAYVERRQGKWRASIANLNRAIRLDPRQVHLFVDLAINHSAVREFAKARAALDRALEIEPGSASLIAAKADAWLEEGGVDEAGELLAALELDPADGDALRSRLKWLLYRRDFPTLTSVLEEALGEPAESLGLYRLYYLLALGASQTWSGNEAEARDSFERAVEQVNRWRESGIDAVHLAQVLAYAHAGLGEESAALNEARRAVALSAGDALVQPTMETGLAQIQAHFGDTEAALAALPHLLTVMNGETVAGLRLDPLWDPLREDSRFQALLKQR